MNKAITVGTLTNLEYILGRDYQFKEGVDLDSVVSEILNNRALNLFLLTYLPPQKGIRLGETSFFDDIKVDLDYGLTISLDTPRKAKLFVTERTWADPIPKLKHITDFFPDYSHYDFGGWPTPEEFAKRFNDVFSRQKLDNYVVRLVR